MNFDQAVYQVVRTVPYGTVATYGQIASLVSTPRAARMVGEALRRLPENTDVPWHRVVNSRGEISIVHFDHPPQEQAEKLRAEHIIVDEKDGRFSVDLQTFGWKP